VSSAPSESGRGAPVGATYYFKCGACVGALVLALIAQWWSGIPWCFTTSVKIINEGVFQYLLPDVA